MILFQPSYAGRLKKAEGGYMIRFNKEYKSFYLETEHTSYVIRILPNGRLMHSYYGAKIPQEDMNCYLLDRERIISPKINGEGYFSDDVILQEYPTAGRGDFRKPAVVVETASGRWNSELEYCSYEILKGKPEMEGLPQLCGTTEECETLKLVLCDKAAGYEAILYYSVFADVDVIARHTEIKNVSEKAIRIQSVASACFDMPQRDYEMLTLEGGWAKERSVERYPLHHGISSIESRRGSSSHMLNPFAALVSAGANEELGEVYGFSFVYSGDFQICTELGQGNDIRVMVGMNPETFSWKLEPQEQFVSPEALLVYSAQGLGGMSRCYHDACRKYLGRYNATCKQRPIVVNCWEAMYFDLSEQKLIDFMKDCKGLGIDTFVMDDGWFGNRNDETTSLGDWQVNLDKFPNGLETVIAACHENGMQFGIWLEPEMISPESRLYKTHPDWCIHDGNRDAIKSRHQLVLDMARPEVVEYIYNTVATLLTQYDISYVKWDMNRNITDNGATWLTPECQKEHSHRYILGVYRLMERLTTDFPHVFFEGCSGGGGRFDFGILYYMPQIWTSDCSDAIERLKIQYGTSMVYPPAAMVGHVSVCPNHQTGRNVPFQTRGDVAQMCNFGYELHIGLLAEEERTMVLEQTAYHKQIESLILQGDFYRLLNPFEGNMCAWQLVSKDKRKSVVTFVNKLAGPNDNPVYLRLQGLSSEKQYCVEPLGVVLSGDTLMHAGIPFLLQQGDFMSCVFNLVQVGCEEEESNER